MRHTILFIPNFIIIYFNYHDVKFYIMLVTRPTSGLANASIPREEVEAVADHSLNTRNVKVTR